MISVNGPPLTEISSTSPSKLVSRSIFRLKLSCEVAELMENDGDTRYSSEIQFGSFAKAALGALTNATAEVTHLAEAPQVTPNEAVQPAGNTGAATPSKF